MATRFSGRAVRRKFFIHRHCLARRQRQRAESCGPPGSPPHMDPLSVSVGVVAILGAAINISEGIERLRESRKLPDEFSTLLAEVSDLHHVLRQCESETSEASKADRAAETRLRECGVCGYADRAKSKLDELETLLVKKNKALASRTLRDELKTAWSAVVNGKTKLDRYRDDFRDIRLGLTASLQVLACKTVLKVDQTVHHLSAGQDNLESTSKEILETVRFLAAQAQSVALQSDDHPPAYTPRRVLPSSDHVQTSTMTIRKVNADVMRKQRPVRLQDVDIPKSGFFRKSCVAWCSCQCHSPAAVRSFSSTRNILGALSVTHSGLPYLAKKCNEKSCLVRSSPSVNIRYRFPETFVQRLLVMSFSFDALAGPEIRVRLPRVVDWNSPAWAYAMHGNLVALQNLFRNGLASPWDVNPLGGNLLHASYVTDHWNADLCRMLLDTGVDPLAEDDLKSVSVNIAWEQVLSGKMSADEASTVASIFRDTDYLSSRSFTVLHKIVLGLFSKDLDYELQCSTADINVGDSRGRTPLSWAAARGDELSTRILLSHGADPDLADDCGCSPLHFVKNTACAQLLMRHHANINSLNHEGQTPLYTACRNTHSASLIDHLIKAGADVNALDYSLQSPLHVGLFQSKYRPFMDILLDAGAQVNIRNDSGDTPVNFAIQHNLHRILRRILQMGEADFSGVNNYSMTFAHSIARSADVETVAILANARPATLMPDTTTLDQASKTSLDYFEERLALVEPDENEQLRKAFEHLFKVLGVADPASEAPVETTNTVLLADTDKPFDADLDVSSLQVHIEEICLDDEDIGAKGTANELFHDAQETWCF